MSWHCVPNMELMKHRSTCASAKLLIGIAAAMPLLLGCPSIAPFGQGEPCFFAFESDSMETPAFCTISMVSREPCLEAAECLCGSWLPSGTDDEIASCVNDELDPDNDSGLSLLCGTEANLSVGSVIRAYAVIQAAAVSTAGPCDQMPTTREDVPLVD
jgi:hypothetical protein